MPGPGVIIAMVLVVALIFFGFYMIIKGKASTDVGISSAVYCNNFPDKICGCFFKEPATGCPKQYVQSQKNYKYCPADSLKCTLEEYPKMVKTAQKEKKYGTCCIFPEGEVSESRLHEPIS